ncbi:MAG TPA: SAM-dependent chlorinase/fluorinase, partial [Nitrospiraceae bacterium]|nr:SAM-dependent chlorinase/fluorinase [Nitrospiraceae bacterium]
VDISHHVSPHSIDAAAYLLKSCYRYFPEGTVHVAVVDPGVGSARRPLIVKSEQYFFLAPDNGLLTPILAEDHDMEVREIENVNYRLTSPGRTFDGRDLFAPAAAWVAKGEPVSSFGRVINDPVTRSIVNPIWQGQSIIGQIEHVDRFGNLISNITVKHIQEFLAAAGRQHLVISIGTYAIHGLVTSYSEGTSGTPSALINSCGKLEIFLDRHDAAQRLQISVGEEIRLC